MWDQISDDEELEIAEGSEEAQEWDEVEGVTESITPSGSEDLTVAMQIEDYEISQYIGMGITACGTGVLVSLGILGIISILRKAG